ncbi:MAG: hypothetical protein AAB911_01580 [Patescibacteria group bacterium]
MNSLEEVEAREICFLYFFIMILFFVGVAASIIEEYEKKISINTPAVTAKSIDSAEYYEGARDPHI